MLMDKALNPWESRIGRRLRLRDLHILATVVRRGSMAKAATHLGMTQPAVSEAVAKLEHALRVRLLDRNARGIEPTFYALALLKRSDVVFDELQQGIRDIEFLADPTVGEVRIASPETLFCGLVPAAIDRLLRAYPGISVSTLGTGRNTLEFQELRERAVDLSLARLAEPFAADDLEIEVLGQDQHFVVAGLKSPWTRRRKVALEELVNEQWIFTPNQIQRALVTEAFRLHGLAVPRERVNAGSFLTQQYLLATGRFLTIMPSILLRQNAKPFSLKALPIDLGIAPQSLVVVTLKNRTVSPVVGLFVAQLRDVAKTMCASAG